MQAIFVDKSTIEHIHPAMANVRWSIVVVTLVIVSAITVLKLESNTQMHIRDSHSQRRLAASTDQTTNYMRDDGVMRDCITGEPLLADINGLQFEQKHIEFVKEGQHETSIGRRRAFVEIFKKRSWGTNFDKTVKDIEASGPSSTLQFVQEAIGVLHLLVSRIKRNTGRDRVSILDLPCGDMVWMSRFLQTRGDIDYTGLDIVPDIIQHHKNKYREFPWEFDVFDAVQKPINTSYDLIISRIALPHLPLSHIVKALKHFSDSGSTYLLTTTYPHFRENIPLHTLDDGIRFRPINLELPPIALTRPVCITKDGPYGQHNDPYLGLWKLPLNQTKTCDTKHREKILPLGRPLYSCSEMESV